MWQNPVILPQQTNREKFQTVFDLFDEDTGERLDLSAFTFVFEVRRPIPGINGVTGSGYSPYYDIGNYDSAQPVITLSLNNGIMVTDIGQVSVTITTAQMRTLSPAVYDLGFTLTDTDGESMQILLGRLPVVFGGVS